MPARISHGARVLPVLLALGTAGCLFAGAEASPSTSAGPSGSAAPSATAVPTPGMRLLPDLGMALMRNFSIDTTVPGETRLRFTTLIINIGDGPMLLMGQTLQGNGDLLVDQQIATSGGGLVNVPSDFRMYFAGDGHQHWHLRDLATFELHNPGAAIQATSAKHGFCFFDSDAFNVALPGAPESAVHLRTDCGRASDLSVTTGLSVGWSDKYDAKLPDQYIDITGLPSGDYTLTATVDAQGFLLERCETNNTTAVIIRITGTSLKIVDHGDPSAACP